MTGAAAILLYHRVDDSGIDPWGLCVTPRHFAEHVDVVADRFVPVSLAELATGLDRGDLPPRSVAITFDDGYADVLHQGVPRLADSGVPATLFLVSEMIGADREFWWDELESILLRTTQLPRRLELGIGADLHRWDFGDAAGCRPALLAEARGWRAWDDEHPSPRHAAFVSLWEALRRATATERRRALDALRSWASQTEHAEEGTARHGRRSLTRDEVAALGRRDGIEIAAHTRSHPALGGLTRAQQRDEIAGSKGDLERIVERPVTSFSYPFGHPEDYTPETVALVRAAGFVRACANNEGIAGPGSDRYELPRLNIFDCDGPGLEARLESALLGR